MKSSCIKHPPDEPLIIIRQWQREYCDNNNVAAALLSFFEYWHNIKIEISRKNKRINAIASNHGEEASQDESLVQFHTEKELIDGIMHIGKRDKVRQALRLLEKKGAIAVTSNPNPKYKFDKTRYFEFSPDVINQWLSEKQLPMSKNRRRESKSLQQSSEKQSAITEITPEITSENSLSLLSLSQNGKPEKESEREAEPPRWGAQQPEEEYKHQDSAFAVKSSAEITQNAVVNHEGNSSAASFEKIVQPNHIEHWENAWLEGRRYDSRSGKYASKSSDPWMTSDRNVVQEVAEYHLKKQQAAYPDKVISIVNIKSELRNDCMRAQDIYEQYLEDKKVAIAEEQRYQEMREPEKPVLTIVPPVEAEKKQESKSELSTTIHCYLKIVAALEQPRRAESTLGHLRGYIESLIKKYQPSEAKLVQSWKEELFKKLVTDSKKFKALHEEQDLESLFGIPSF